MEIFQNTESIAIVALFLISLALIFFNIRNEVRLAKIFRGSKVKSLEGHLADLVKRIAITDEGLKVHEEALNDLNTRITRSIRDAQTVRFQAFSGAGEGGNQSFATALLNEKGNGVIISSIHTRERVGIYAKPIENFESKYELSKEEASVLEKSRNS